MEPIAILVALVAAGAVLLIVNGLLGSSPVDPVQARLNQFRGGALPTNGLAIPANSEDIVSQDGGWKTNDSLFFEASGFAMPRVPPQRMRAPARHLGARREIEMQRADHRGLE